MTLLHHRARLSIAAALLCLLLPVGLVLVHLLDLATQADETLEAVCPRHARLAGLRDAATPVTEAAAAAEARLQRYAYPASSNADRLGTDLQQRLRAAAEAAGVAVVGSQIVAGKPQDGLDEIPVSMTLEAELGPLQQMLQALAEQAPAVYADSINIQAQRRRGATENRLNVQVRFSVLRRQS